MKAAVITQVGQINVSDFDDPIEGKDEVLIKVFASGVCGTDIHIYDGGFGGNLPLISGHEFAGEVIAVGENCQRIKVGDRVAVEPNIPCNNCMQCLSNRHHHCSHMIIPGVNQSGGMAELCKVKEVGVFPIGDLPYEMGAFVEPLSCVIHGINRIKPKMGERCLILGAGPIAIQLAWIAQAKGFSQIDFLEKNNFRLNFIKKYQLGDAYNDCSQISYKEYDAILDATGATNLVNQMLKHLRVMGRLLIFGVASETAILSFNHYDIFRREIEVIGSYTSIKDSMKAIEILKSGKIPITDIITDYTNLDGLEKGILRLKNGAENMMKLMVNPHKL